MTLRNGGLPRSARKQASPNVIIFLLDDVGFAQVESFGGLISTPNIDALADNGHSLQQLPHDCALLTVPCHVDGRT